ncbi:alpha/beta fold hydrolase [Bradyrhizobium diazoefficiens]
MNDMTTMTIDGVSTRVLTAGAAGSGEVVLLHGGSPGLSPFCGGLHLWGSVIDRIAQHRRVIAPDLLGSGQTGRGDGPLTVDRMVSHATALIKAVATQPVDLVGHDLGGMVALRLAMESPELLNSLSIVASAAASPTGDGVENLSLLSPPQPLWSRESQAWAYDRLSYSHHHIDETLVASSVAGAPQASASIDDGRDLAASIMRSKSLFFRHAREQGLQVPVQVIWAKNDPLVTVDHGFWLYRIVAAKQRAAHFHIINRSGSFPFREQPDEFLRVLSAFQDGLVSSAAVAASA